MTYILENQQEFDRLENQSLTECYNYKLELSEFVGTLKQSNPKKILDAGCGSGLVTRYLAGLFPDSTVIGCDGSNVRKMQAESASKNFSNINWINADLTELPIESQSLDAVVCRYVIQHLSKVQRTAFLKEIYRCLKPGGWVCVIDIEGVFKTVYPVNRIIKRGFNKILSDKRLDLEVASKMPSLFSKLKFNSISWRASTMSFNGPNQAVEAQLMKERLESARSFFSEALGGEKELQIFEKEYLAQINDPFCVSYYTKIVTLAQKPESNALLKNESKLKVVSFNA